MADAQQTTLCPEDHRPCDGSCGVAETGECGRERTETALQRAERREHLLRYGALVAATWLRMAGART